MNKYKPVGKFADTIMDITVPASTKAGEPMVLQECRIGFMADGILNVGVAIGNTNCFLELTPEQARKLHDMLEAQMAKLSFDPALDIV